MGNEIIIKDRTIYLYGDIDDDKALDVVSSIDLLNKYDESEELEFIEIMMDDENQTYEEAYNEYSGSLEQEPIYLEINSRGGATSAGYSIITAINNSKAPVVGYVTGDCMSMAVAILACCDFRVSSEYSEFMIHDVYSGMEGKFNDLNSTIGYVERIRNNYKKVLVEYTDLTEQQVEELVDMNSDHYFSPKEAKDMGVIDALDTDNIEHLIVGSEGGDQVVDNPVSLESSGMQDDDIKLIAREALNMMLAELTKENN